MKMKTLQKIIGLKRVAVLLLLGGAAIEPAQAAAPVVSNVRAVQRAGSGIVDIYYDVSSANNPLTVSLAISTNGGVAFNAPAVSLSGDWAAARPRPRASMWCGTRGRIWRRCISRMSKCA